MHEVKNHETLQILEREPILALSPLVVLSRVKDTPHKRQNNGIAVPNAESAGHAIPAQRSTEVGYIWNHQLDGHLDASRGRGPGERQLERVPAVSFLP